MLSSFRCDKGLCGCRSLEHLSGPALGLPLGRRTEWDRLTRMRRCPVAFGIAVVLCASLLGRVAAQSADHVLIVKSTRTLTLLNHGQVLKTDKVALGGDPVGAKTKAGDQKTPEGEYIIDSKNPHSRFHLALHISYPNPQTVNGRASWV
jgi:hypothetical protein